MLPHAGIEPTVSLYGADVAGFYRFAHLAPGESCTPSNLIKYQRGHQLHYYFITYDAKSKGYAVSHIALALGG